MTTRSKLALLIGLALLLLAAVLAWAALHPGPRPAEARLPDGTTVRLAGISTGAVHSLPRTWRTRVSQFAPPPVKRLLGPAFTSSFGFGDPGLAVWLMRYDPALGAYQRGWAGNCVAVDEHGCEFPSGGNGATGDGTFFARVINLSAHPRRQKEFVCRILDPQGKALAELPVPNPELSTAAPWEPLPLPVRLTNGPLTLVLERFESPVAPRFSVFRNGAKEEFWAAERTAFEDATGNRGWSLCVRESAWQWTATLHRKVGAPFAPDELATLANVLLPAPGSLISRSADLRIGGTSVPSVSLAGPGRYDWTNGLLSASAPWQPGMSPGMGSSSGGIGRSWTALWRATDRPFLILPHLPLPADARLTIRIRQNGKTVGAAESAGAAQGFYLCDLPLNLPPGPIDLDFIVDPGYKFSARVAPAEVLGRAP